MLYIISGRYRNRKILSPKNLETRPTTGKLRQALFNICQSYIENARFLDVFAGSGAIGLEAISRGAQKATFIDANLESVRCIRENLKGLGIENQSRLLSGDVFASLKKLEKEKEFFEIIYMDPPYEIPNLPIELIKTIDESHLLVPGGMLFIEESKWALIEKEGWLTLRLKSERQMGRSKLLQFEMQS